MDNIENIIGQIKEIAKNYSEITKIILFGSRARGDNRERSDIDIAIFSENINIFDFKYDIETKTDTLLKFDIICIDENTDVKLLNEIKSDGVVIYEKY